jgi:hypothetical protein
MADIVGTVVAGAVDLSGRVSSPSPAPHCPQKLSSASLDAPQAAHALTSGAPHFPQKRRPSRLTDPHEAQFMRARVLAAGSCGK